MMKGISKFKTHLAWRQMICFILGGVFLLIAFLVALPKNNQENPAEESVSAITKGARAAILIECSPTGYGWEEAMQVGGRLTVAISPYTSNAEEITQTVLQNGMEVALQLPPGNETLLSVYGVMQEDITPALSKTLLNDASQIIAGARGVLIPSASRLEMNTLQSLKDSIDKQQYFVCNQSEDVNGSLKCNVVIDCNDYESATAAVSSLLEWFAKEKDGLILLQPGSQYKLRDVVSILQNEGVTLVFVSLL
ncbi:MAG: polysaccharide deacetylase family protein [Christensenellales bacterium]